MEDTFLKGLDLSELIFHEHVSPVIETIFPSLVGTMRLSS